MKYLRISNVFYAPKNLNKDMMLKSVSHFMFIVFLLLTFFTHGQAKSEGEHRIKKSQFPENAISYIEQKLEGTRRIRYYKEIDSNEVIYRAKLKKDRLKYGIRFNKEGHLKNIQIFVKPIDIPNDAFVRMTKYLEQTFLKHRIRRIEQQYPVGDKNIESTVRNAFQNLMLPEIKYELLVSARKNKVFGQYEVTFDSEGNFERLKMALPPNYDHVLY